MKTYRSLVIPAEAGIQPGYQVAPGFRRGDVGIGVMRRSGSDEVSGQYSRSNSSSPTARDSSATATL